MKLRQLILLVAADEVCHALRTVVGGAGYELAHANLARQALRIARATPPDVAVVDSALSDMSISAFLQSWKGDRTLQDIPLFVVEIRWSDAGVDFIADPGPNATAPLGPAQLVQRVRTMVHPGSGTFEGKVYRSSRLHIDTRAHRVTVDGREVVLTLLEFRLLTTLACAHGAALSREQLLRDVWGVHLRKPTRTVDTHLRRLRSKLGSGRDAIETVRGVGYRLRESALSATKGSAVGESGPVKAAVPSLGEAKSSPA